MRYSHTIHASGTDYHIEHVSSTDYYACGWSEIYKGSMWGTFELADTMNDARAIAFKRAGMHFKRWFLF